MVIVAILGLAGMVILGVEGWRIVSALVDAERSVVVPLPTRDAGIELGGAARSSAQPPVIIPADATQTPDREAAITPTRMPNVTVSSSATETPLDQANLAQSTTEPSATATPTIAVTETRHTAAESVDPTVTAIPTVVTTPTPIPTSSDRDNSTDNPSAFDVVRNVVGAGINSDDPTSADIWNGKTAITVLVIGLDRRPDGGDQNADVIIIARLDLEQQTVRAVSIPRDLLVQVPGVGYDKINSAYNHGLILHSGDSIAGVSLMRDTIEYNFGIEIDQYVLFDFNGFTDVIDALGGVDIDVPYEIIDDEYPTEDYGTETIHFSAGLTHMDGATALKYVRTRHADSDDQRRERQLQVLEALFVRGKQVGSISKIDDLIVALGDSAQTSFTLQQQLALARIGLQINPDNLTMSSLAPPILQPGYTETGAWVYTGDTSEIVAFVQHAIFGDQE